MNYLPHVQKHDEGHYNSLVINWF